VDGICPSLGFQSPKEPGAYGVPKFSEF